MRKQILQIAELLKTNLVGKVKTVYKTRPLKIPESALPAIFVEFARDEVSISDSATDRHDAEIIIGVATRRRDGDIENVIDIMQGNDASGDIIYPSVFGLLRHKNQGDHITGGITFEARDASVDYQNEGNLSDETVFCREAKFSLLFLDDVHTISINQATPAPTSTIQSVTTAGITSGMLTSKYIFVAGSPGAVSISSIATPPNTGIINEIVLVGTSDTNTVTLTNSSSVLLDGTQSITLTQNDNISLFFDTQTNQWVESANSRELLYYKRNERIFNVKDFGAKGDNSTDDTTAIQLAIDTTNSLGGGDIFFPSGTFISTLLTFYSNLTFSGSGTGNTIIKLKNSTNTDLFKSYQFDSQAGTNTDPAVGTRRVIFRNLTIDGNRANQTGSGETDYRLMKAMIKIYGYANRWENIKIINAKEVALISENTASPSSGYTESIENHLTDVTCEWYEKIGIVWRGPTDSHWEQVTCASQVSPLYHILIQGSTIQNFYGGSVYGDKVHTWGNATINAFRVEALDPNEALPIYGSFQIEGASVGTGIASCYLYGVNDSLLDLICYSGDIGLLLAGSNNQIKVQFLGFIKNTMLQLGITGDLEASLNQIQVAGYGDITKPTTNNPNGIVVQKSGGLNTIKGYLHLGSDKSFVSGSPSAVDNFDLIGSTEDASVRYLRLKKTNGKTGDIVFDILNNRMNILNLPTSSSGLTTGDIWNNGGVLNIV